MRTLNIPKAEETFLTKITFWADDQLIEKLATVKKGERSFIIRLILRDYFGLTDSRRGILGYQESGPITTDVARLVAKELMNNLKAERS